MAVTGCIVVAPPGLSGGTDHSLQQLPAMDSVEQHWRLTY